MITELVAHQRFPGGAWVTDVFVDPAAAGRGIGAALLGAATRAAKAAGHRALGLAVTVGNPAHRLYGRLGFVSSGETWAIELPM